MATTTEISQLRKAAVDKIRIYIDANSRAYLWYDAVLKRIDDELVCAVTAYADASGQSLVDAVLNIWGIDFPHTNWHR